MTWLTAGNCEAPMMNSGHSAVRMFFMCFIIESGDGVACRAFISAPVYGDEL